MGHQIPKYPNKDVYYCESPFIPCENFKDFHRTNVFKNYVIYTRETNNYIL